MNAPSRTVRNQDVWLVAKKVGLGGLKLIEAHHLVAGAGQPLGMTSRTMVVGDTRIRLDARTGDRALETRGRHRLRKSMTAATPHSSAANAAAEPHRFAQSLASALATIRRRSTGSAASTCRATSRSITGGRGTARQRSREQSAQREDVGSLIERLAAQPFQQFFSLIVAYCNVFRSGQLGDRKGLVTLTSGFQRHWMTIRATYRLQFGPAFGFADAAALAPYLARWASATSTRAGIRRAAREQPWLRRRRSDAAEPGAGQ